MPPDGHKVLELAACCLLASLYVACGPGAALDEAYEPLGPIAVVDTIPIVTIHDDGAPERLLVDAQVRELASGEFAVSDASSLMLRVVDAKGQLVRTIATRGKGPGEWSGQYRWELTGDTIDAFGQPPLGPRRVHSYTVEGRLLGSFESTAADRGTVVVTSRLGSHRWLARMGQIARPLTALPAAGTVWLDSVTYVILDVKGSRAEVAATIPSPAVTPHVAFPSGLQRVSVAIAPSPLLPRQLVAASGDLVWSVNGMSGSMEAFARDGRTVVRSVLPIRPRRISVELVEQERRRQEATAEGERERRRLTAQYDVRLGAEWAPVVDSAIAAPDGGVWLRRFRVRETQTVRYVRVDRAGQIVGEAMVPAWLGLQQITRHGVVGTRARADGTVEIVKLRLDPDP